MIEAIIIRTIPISLYIPKSPVFGISAALLLVEGSGSVVASGAVVACCTGFVTALPDELACPSVIWIGGCGVGDDEPEEELDDELVDPVDAVVVDAVVVVAGAAVCCACPSGVSV